MEKEKKDQNLKEEEIQTVNSNQIISKKVLIKSDKINRIKVITVPVNYSD